MHVDGGAKKVTFMPIFNAVARSYHAMVDSTFSNGVEKQKRVSALRKEIQATDTLVILATSDGWRAIHARHTDTIAKLQQNLEHAGADELKVIQAQIRILREVSSIEKDIERGEEARRELTEIVGDDV